MLYNSTVCHSSVFYHVTPVAATIVSVSSWLLVSIWYLVWLSMGVAHTGVDLTVGYI